MLIDSSSAISWILPSENSHKISRLISLTACFLFGASLLVVCPVAALEPARVIEVGAQRTVKTLSAASRLAKDGAVIEVDGGDYLGDVAVWTQNDLTFRAKNGRVRLIAQGASAESKGIWVVRGGKVTVEGFDFVGASVPDRNGAPLVCARRMIFSAFAAD